MSLFTSPIVRPPVPTGIKLSNPVDLEALRAQTIEEQSALLVSFAGARVLVDAGRLHWVDWVPVAALGGTWLGPVEFDAEGNPFVDSEMTPTVTYSFTEFAMGVRAVEPEDISIRAPAFFEARVQVDTRGDAVSGNDFCALLFSDTQNLINTNTQLRIGLGWNSGGGVRWRLTRARAGGTSNVPIAGIPDESDSLNGLDVVLQTWFAPPQSFHTAVQVDAYGVAGLQSPSPTTFGSALSTWPTQTLLAIRSVADLTAHRFTLKTIRWSETPEWMTVIDVL